MANTLAKLRENLRDGFKRLTGGPQSALARQCEDCVADALATTPWPSIEELCRNVNGGDIRSDSDTVLQVLSRKISSSNPRGQIHCLAVSDMCVRRCGPLFHERLAISQFFQRVQQAIRDPNAAGMDAQVLDRMLSLVEDWARSLPQPQFGAALSVALEAGAQVPHRPEQDKAPLFDAASYDLQRREQVAAQHTFFQQQQAEQQEQQQRMSAGRSARQGDYAHIGESPAQPRQGQPGAPPHGAPPQPQIDQAVLDSLDPADRAAVLAAQFGDGGAAAADAPQSEPPPPDDMPAFDIDGSLEQLQADLGVATDNVGVLDELMAAEAPPELLNEVLRRCRAMRGAVHRVIDRVRDESTLDHAVQVQTELTRVLQEYDARVARTAAAAAGEPTSRQGAYVALGGPGHNAAPISPQPSAEYAPFQYPAPTDVSSSLGDGSQPLRQDPAFSLLGPGPQRAAGAPQATADNPFAAPPPAPAAAAPDLINFDAPEESKQEAAPAAAPDSADPFAAPAAGGAAPGMGADPFSGQGFGTRPQAEAANASVVHVDDVTAGVANLGADAQAPPPPGPSI